MKRALVATVLAVVAQIAWSDSVFGQAPNSKALAGKSWGDKSKGFYLAKNKDALDIYLDGKQIASYVFRHKRVFRPFFAHVKTPSGIQVTRNFPPIEGKDPIDHDTMHPGIWMSFARLNGVTFWHNREGRVVHKGFVGEPSAGKTAAAFSVLNDYVAPSGEVICRQQTNYRLMKDPDGYLMTLDARFSSKKKFVFGVIEEMGLGVRVTTPIRVRGGNGSIVSSNGGKNEKGTWGKFAEWWDYFGVVGGSQVGVMLMSGPGNPKVWSHSRDYGLLVANPFPVDRKENRKKVTIVAPGREFRLRFGALVHEHGAGRKFERESAYRRFIKSWD